MKHKLNWRFLPLSLFLLLIQNSGAPAQTQKVKADTNKWTEVSAITSGKHYIISATRSNGDSYYLQAGEYRQTPVATQLVDVENLDLAHAWTFISADNGYVITSAGGHRLHVEAKSTIGIQALIANTPGLVSTYAWTFADKMLKNNDNYLSLVYDTGTLSWRSPTKIAVTDYVYELTMYEYCAGDVGHELERFISVKDAWVGTTAKGKCEEFVPLLLNYYDGLSAEAREQFLTNTRYEAHRDDMTYFRTWYTHYGASQPALPLQHTTKEIPLLSIMVLSVVAVSTYFLIIKQKKEHK